jgi:hypothetical protein
MMNQDNQGERDLRERIRSRMQATELAHKKQITGEELEKLKTAASRLDQMLKAAEVENVQALKDAASRLDQLLAKIGKGKDVSSSLKRRADRQGRDE